MRAGVHLFVIYRSEIVRHFGGFIGLRRKAGGGGNTPLQNRLQKTGILVCFFRSVDLISPKPLQNSLCESLFLALR